MCEENDEDERKTLAQPEPVIISKITHHSIECTWKHVRASLPKNQRFKYILQELSPKNKGEWYTVYT